MERIGAAIWATGRAGQEMLRAGLLRPWLDFRAGIVFNPAKDGLDLGEACGLATRVGANVSTDVEAVLARPDIDVVFYCGMGRPEEVAEACLRANRAGKDLVSIAGPTHPKTALGAEGAAELDAAIRATGRRSLATGFWEFLTLTLPLAAISNSVSFDELRLERVADLGRWGPGILRDEGIGGPVETSGGGFMMRNLMYEAFMLLAESLALDIDDPVFTTTPVLAGQRRARPDYAVEPGTVAGYDRRLAADVRGGGRLVSLWRGRFALDPAADGMRGSARVVLTGDPEFAVTVAGPIFDDGYPSTATRALAAVRPLRALPPGLHTVDEIGLRPSWF